MPQCVSRGTQATQICKALAGGKDADPPAKLPIRVGMCPGAASFPPENHSIASPLTIPPTQPCRKSVPTSAEGHTGDTGCDTCELRGRTPAPLFQVTELIVPGFRGPSVQWNTLSIKESKIIRMTRHQASGPKECVQEALAYHSCIHYYVINIIQPPTMECLYAPSQLRKLGGRVDCGNACR